MDLSKIKILKFTRDPTNYIRFIKTFVANVESLIKDFNRRLLLLTYRVLFNARPTKRLFACKVNFTG